MSLRTESATSATSVDDERAPTHHGSLLFAEDVAARIGMTKDWIYAETRAGRIPHITLGRYYRYRPESIDEWIRRMERGLGSAEPASRRGR
jgi:excisionase family DNA binding protein